jgi:hypothetical protein
MNEENPPEIQAKVADEEIISRGVSERGKKLQ